MEQGGPSSFQHPVRIALWGIGAIYREHINLLLAMQALGQIELVVTVDTTPPPVSQLDGMPVATPAELASFGFDYLLLMNKNHTDEMLSMAVGRYGIPREAIRTYRLLHVPGIDFRSYKRLCESRLSIVANNCWGGLAYHALQMECLSPFKNCFFSESDYIHVLENLEHYMAIDDVPFIEARYDKWNNRVFLYRLGDIELLLAHEEKCDVALDKWHKRRKRINWNSLFVEFFTSDRLIEERFESLEQYPQRVCFVPYESKMPHSVQIPVFPNKELFDFSVNETVLEGGKDIALNLINLLLGESDTRRYCL